MKRLQTLTILIALSVWGFGCADSQMGLVDTGDTPPSDYDQSRNPDNGQEGWEDSDGDGVVDRFDNCPQTHNPAQEDTDRDGVGDACDNCKGVANLNQVDSDEDGIGDACTDDDEPQPDSDGDGRPDVSDNCPMTANADQADGDADGVGDVCDNCPEAVNASQADEDADGVGNKCDPDYRGPTCYSQEFTPDVSTIEPSIYMMLDTSGSMANELDPNRPRPWPIDQAVSAIGTIADSLHTSARIGLGRYPFQTESGSTCTSEELVDIGQNSAGAIKMAVDGLTAIGNTPTGYALNQILDQGLLDDQTDMLNTRRPKAAILITDGDPTVACGSGTPDNRRVAAQPEAVEAAARLKDAGIPVYVVGFISGALPENLNEIAAAGGTDAPGPERFYTANDAAQLVQAVEAITQHSVSCTYQLDNVPNDMDKVYVSINGQEIQEDNQNGFSFDRFAGLVKLHGSSCDMVQNAADPAQMRITVDITCVEDDENQCAPQAELCDNLDNDCDGEVDEEACDDDHCGFEVCDGGDNDCDEQIDEGCPTCSLLGDACSTDSDCCNAACVDGTCTAECRPMEVACVKNEDCCSGACSGSESSPGVCIPQ